MKKKVLISVVVVLMLLSIICCTACGLFGDKKFDEVVRCAKVVRDMNDETFEIIGDAGYIKGWEDDDGYYYNNVFIVIQFQVKNEAGDEVIDVAYFVDGNFVGYDSDYGDGDDNAVYKQWDKERKLYFLASILIFMDGYYDEIYKKDKIIAELAKDVPSDVVSGEEGDAE